MKHIVDFFEEHKLHLSIKTFKAVNYTNVTLRIVDDHGQVTQMFYPTACVPPIEMKFLKTIEDYSMSKMQEVVSKFLSDLFYSPEEGSSRPRIHTQDTTIALPDLDLDLFSRIRITELMETAE